MNSQCRISSRQIFDSLIDVILSNIKTKNRLLDLSAPGGPLKRNMNRKMEPIISAEKKSLFLPFVIIFVDYISIIFGLSEISARSLLLAVLLFVSSMLLELLEFDKKLNTAPGVPGLSLLSGGNRLYFG